MTDARETAALEEAGIGVVRTCSSCVSWNSSDDLVGICSQIPYETSTGATRRARTPCDAVCDSHERRGRTTGFEDFEEGT